jgi:hypothetical protein
MLSIGMTGFADGLKRSPPTVWALLLGGGPWSPHRQGPRRLQEMALLWHCLALIALASATAAAHGAFEFNTAVIVGSQVRVLSCGVWPGGFGAAAHADAT